MLMVAAGLPTMLGQSISASLVFPALTFCVICAALLIVVWPVIQEIRNRASESRMRQNLRIYLHNCERDNEAPFDRVVPPPETEAFEDPRQSTARIANHQREAARA